MANEHLKTALRNAGLTLEQFAEIITVDPKTVQRWVAGRTPYPRHRATISRALDLPEHDLWPDDVPPPESDSERERSAIGDVTGAWGNINASDAPALIDFLTEGAQRIEILDDAGVLLKAPGLLEALRDRAFEGCEARVLTGMPQELGALTGSRAIDVRVASARSDVALLRADDTMLLTIMLSSSGAPALLELRRHDRDGLFDRLAEHFQVLWDEVEILTESRKLGDSQPDADGAVDPLRDRQLGELQEEPSTPIAPRVEPPPRRWPRRPS